jgi:predicted SnoaL-like aldol condensation-catalyzing enzyme
MYRLEDGKLAEHWDVLQQIDPDDPGASGNGHF